MKIIKKEIEDAKVELTTQMTGKMENMVSINTSTLHNPCCERNSMIPGSICQHCYARNMLKMYKSLSSKCDRNTELLTTRILEDKELPDCFNYKCVRFEAFGDIYNETHLTNYINIAKKNRDTRFTLWTKNYPVALKYFSEHKCPDNMTLIISSLFVNQERALDDFKATGAFVPGQLKVFTVYDYKYLKSEADKGTPIDINCGALSCVTCLKCYRKNDIEIINEVLKSNQHKEAILKSKINGEFDKESNIMADSLEEFEL